LNRINLDRIFAINWRKEGKCKVISGKKLHTDSWRKMLLLSLMLVLVALLVVGCDSKSGTPAPTSGGQENTSSTPVSTNQQGSTTAGNETSIAKNECSECHEMWPEIATWQTSVHANVPCLTCHKDYNVTDNKAAHDSGAFQKPISIRTKPVTDDACTGCHAMQNRDATLLPDLIAPHAKHAAAKISCLECHRFTTHGNIAERKVTTRPEFSDYNKWNPQLAQKVAPGVQRRPNMFVCIKCHEARKVTTACNACHYWPDRKSLPSHETPLWAVSHGKPGRQDVNNCAKCHYDKESLKFATPSTGDQIADFARANSYCFGCHLKRPANHDTNWMPNHSSVAKEKGLLNCFACHDKNQPGANVTGTYCNTCHWFQTPPPPAKADPAKT